MLDREGYFFSISGGWKKVLRNRGPCRTSLENMYVRARTDRSDWRPEDLIYIKPKKKHIWDKIDWEWVRRYLRWRWDGFKKFFKKIWNSVTLKHIEIPNSF